MPASDWRVIALPVKPIMGRRLRPAAPELRLLWQRPVTRAVAAGLLVLVAVPTYVGRWAGLMRVQHITGAGAIASELVPSQAAAFVAGVLGGGFGGLLAFVFGAVVFGSDYGWGTAAARVANGARRWGSALRRLAALAVSLLAMVALAVGATFALSLVVAHPDFGLSMRPPTPVALLQGIGVGWLLLLAWAGLGALFATLLRSAVAAMAVGVLYVMAFETPIRNMAWHARELVGIRNATLDGLGHAASRLVHINTAPEHADPTLAAAVLAAVAFAGACGTVAAAARQDL